MVKPGALGNLFPAHSGGSVRSLIVRGIDRTLTPVLLAPLKEGWQATSKNRAAMQIVAGDERLRKGKR